MFSLIESVPRTLFVRWSAAVRGSLIAATLVTMGGLTQAVRAADTITINGAGSTFAYPLYSKWFDQYHQIDPNVQFNYQSIGSGGGIRQVIAGTVDFGGTDGPMTPAQMKDFETNRGGHILHFPTALGADVACYNLPGVDQKLNFTPDALAGIFLGKITRWNDPEIAKANPDVKLPDTDIIVVHRADGSGTTYVWADYLAKVSPQWKKDVGVSTSLKWPVGLGAKGNEGVAGQVMQTPGAIGYVELIYAAQNSIHYGRAQNAAGKFIDADFASVTAAAAGAANDMPEDFRVSITNAPGNDAYPISSFTWLLIPDKIQDATKREAIIKFLHWSLAQGQDALEPLKYAKLPASVVKQEEQAIAKIKQ